MLVALNARHSEGVARLVEKPDLISFANPGNFRLELETARSGGISDPRNGDILKMFNLIDIGERAGSGIPNIFRVWEKQPWDSPVYTETYDPDRVTLTLPLATTIRVGVG